MGNLGYMHNKERQAYFKEKWQSSKNMQCDAIKNGQEKCIYGISRGQICAKALPSSKQAVDACQGDSGGPLVFGLTGLEKWQKENGKGANEAPDPMDLTDEEIANQLLRKWTLVGITSWGCDVVLTCQVFTPEPRLTWISSLNMLRPLKLLMVRS